MGKRSSLVWKHFSSTDGEKAKCGYCSAMLSFKGGSTANLIRHIKSKHPFTLTSTSDASSDINPDITVKVENELDIKNSSDSQSFSEFSETDPLSTASTSTTRSRVLKRKRSGGAQESKESVSSFLNKNNPMPLQKSKTIDAQLVRMLVKEFQPVSIVEDKEFVEFIHMLNPYYKLPSRKKLSNGLIPQAYHKTKKLAQKELTGCEAVSLTMDSWTSINNESYTAVTAHFLNDSLELKSFLLECVELPEGQTPENLQDDLQRVFKEWNIDQKIEAIVSDNSANIRAAVKLGNWCHVRCFAYSLNLIAQTAINDIADIKRKVKTIGEHFNRNSLSLERLHDTQLEMGLPMKNLTIDVPTRWSSTYKMLQRVLELKEPLLSTMDVITHTLPTISACDWNIIEGSCKILEIFQQVADEMCSEANFAISKIIPLLKIMRRTLNKIDSDSELPPEIRQMVFSCLHGITTRLGSSDEISLLSESTLLDPRFKKRGFENDESFQTAYHSVGRLAANIHIANESPGVELMELQSQNTKTENTVRTSVWDEFDQEIFDEMRNPTKANINICLGIMELDKYLQDNYILRTEDPLLWWESKKLEYPRLYQIIRKRFCTIASSVPCERIFSKPDLLISDRRNRLSPKHISQVVFLNSNME